jgi:hypothetical protein
VHRSRSKLPGVSARLRRHAREHSGPVFARPTDAFAIQSHLALGICTAGLSDRPAMRASGPVDRASLAILFAAIVRAARVGGRRTARFAGPARTATCVERGSRAARRTIPATGAAISAETPAPRSCREAAFGSGRGLTRTLVVRRRVHALSVRTDGFVARPAVTCAPAVGTITRDHTIAGRVAKSARAIHFRRGVNAVAPRRHVPVGAAGQCSVVRVRSGDPGVAGARGEGENGSQGREESPREHRTKIAPMGRSAGSGTRAASSCLKQRRAAGRGIGRA